MENIPLCKKLQYLIGVPAKYIDDYDTLNDGVWREIRKLCSLRSMIIANFTEINEQFSSGVELRDIDATGWIVNDLALLGITINNAHSLSRNVMALNELIDDRVKDVSLEFDYLPEEWIQELLHMPNGDTVGGVQDALRRYRQFKNYYPYQRYINWPFAETPEEKRSKNVLGNDRTLHEMLADIHRNKFTQLCDFAGVAGDAVVVVDCENSDAQRLYDSMEVVKHLARKIILVDDTHTNLMWDEIVQEFRKEGISIEHDELPRLKEQKSLVDLRVVAKACEEHYKNNIQHFILVSSDSDMWALINSLQDATFLVLAERCKSGDVYVEELTKQGIKYMFMEDIVEESTLLQDRIVRREIAKRMRWPCYNVKSLVSKVLKDLNLYLDKEAFHEYVLEALGEVVPVEDIGKEKIIVMPE